MVAAFFDIDGTIYRDSLLMEHFKKLIKYELFNSLEYEMKVKESFENWNNRMGDYDMYLLGLADLYVEAIDGIPVKYNDFVADQVVELRGDRVYRYTRERIQWHKEQGHKVIFISGSPDFLVSRMAKKWDADDFKGTKYFVEDGKFNGKLSPMWDAKNKIMAIEEFKEKYDLDLENSYAYGDTMGDLSMFESVGKATAINPSKELITTLRGDEKFQKKVQVVIERKDVIYKVCPDVEVITD